MNNLGLGRRHSPDERDARWPMSLARVLEVLPAYRYWTPGPILDQNGWPHCVAYAWKGWLLASPTRQGAPVVEQAVYDEAQLLDEWPGEGYDGTSVRAGAKVLQGRGFISNYLWATDAPQIRDWVLSRGPVVVGTNWYQSMFAPNSESGFVTLAGGNAGGHAYLVIGYSMARRAFRCLNSWGPTWGQRGRFWLHENDMQRLLAEQGEAVTAVEQRISASTG